MSDDRGGGSGPTWAVLTVWVVVNSVSLLQSVGFVSRVTTGERDVNHLLGIAIMALAVPAAGALTGFLRSRAETRLAIGPIAFLAFTTLALAVDYVWRIEFRDPARVEILVPYLTLFFGSILLMGLPMFRIDVRKWLVTVATTVMLLASMGYAMLHGVA